MPSILAQCMDSLDLPEIGEKIQKALLDALYFLTSYARIRINETYYEASMLQEHGIVYYNSAGEFLLEVGIVKPTADEVFFLDLREKYIPIGSVCKFDRLNMGMPEYRDDYRLVVIYATNTISFCSSINVNTGIRSVFIVPNYLLEFLPVDLIDTSWDIRSEQKIERRMEVDSGRPVYKVGDHVIDQDGDLWTLEDQRDPNTWFVSSSGPKGGTNTLHTSEFRFVSSALVEIKEDFEIGAVDVIPEHFKDPERLETELVESFGETMGILSGGLTGEEEAEQLRKSEEDAAALRRIAGRELAAVSDPEQDAAEKAKTEEERLAHEEQMKANWAAYDKARDEIEQKKRDKEAAEQAEEERLAEWAEWYKTHPKIDWLRIGAGDYDD